MAVEDAALQTAVLNPLNDQQNQLSLFQDTTLHSPDLQEEVFQSENELESYDETSFKSQLQENVPVQQASPIQTDSVENVVVDNDLPQSFQSFY